MLRRRGGASLLCLSPKPAPVSNRAPIRFCRPIGTTEEIAEKLGVSRKPSLRGCEARVQNMRLSVHEPNSLRKKAEPLRNSPSAAKADIDFHGLFGTVEIAPFQSFPISAASEARTFQNQAGFFQQSVELCTVNKARLFKKVLERPLFPVCNRSVRHKECRSCIPFVDALRSHSVTIDAGSRAWLHILEETLNSFGREIRLVLRRLVRTPLFTIVTVLTLGIGVGANVAVFSVVEGVLLKPLPYPHPEMLVSVWHAAPGLNLDELNMAPANYFTCLPRAGASFPENIGMYQGDSVSVTGRGNPGAGACARCDGRSVADSWSDTDAGAVVQPRRCTTGQTRYDDSELWVLAVALWFGSVGGGASDQGGRQEHGRLLE